MTTMKSAAKTKSTRKGDIEAIKLPNPNGIDLLVLAFSRIGGSAEAVARELGVTERRVYFDLGERRRRSVLPPGGRPFGPLRNPDGVAENRANGVKSKNALIIANSRRT